MVQSRITNLLEEHSHRQGSKTAWIQPETGKQLSYQEAFHAVKRTASRIRKIKTGSDGRIGLAMEKGIPFTIALLGIIRSGHIAIPLPVQWSEREQNNAVTHCAIKTIITDSEHENPIRNLQTVDTVVSMDPPKHNQTIFLDRLNTGPERLDSQTSDALWLFTSGTTGDPKPVRLTHKNLLAHTRISNEWFHLTADDLWMIPLPFHHMGGLGALFRTLYAGASLVIPPASHTGLRQSIKAYPATFLSMVPTQFRRLIDDPSSTVPDSLRVLLVGGDRIPPKLARQSITRGWPVHGSYGTTETCSHIAIAPPDQYQLNPKMPKATVLPEVNITIEKQEIIVEGPMVSPGYQNLTIGTGPRFSDDGFHTGDAGKMTENGKLIVEGRLDQRIITGGETVVPGEIEDVLEEHSAVHEAVVVGISDQKWGQSVSTYVELQTEGTISREELAEHSRNQLADYKIPKHWKFGSIPRTASGKPDRQTIKNILDS